MRLLRQKIFFETTEEMKETKKNIKDVKNKIVSEIKKVVNKKPEEVFKNLKSTGKKTVKLITSPKLSKRVLNIAGKKIVNYIKKNPRDAFYLAAGNLIPIGVGKVVSEKKGEKAGAAAAGIATALPIGEVAVGIDHLSRSEKGKTAMKATGQIIKGVASDLGNIIIRRKRK